MIYHISNVVGSEHPVLDWREFLFWIDTQSQYQFDIETTVTQAWNNKELISLQFGSCDKDVQYFIQWSEITDNQRLQLQQILERRWQMKIIHNARFEYIVLRGYGIILENLYDTMIAEKVLFGGQESIEYSLDDMVWRYMKRTMNKALQTEFGDNIMTDMKLEYGCTDVQYLAEIKRQQIEKAVDQELINVFGLEMEVIPAFSDITYEGMILDKEKWRANIKLAEPLVEEAFQTMSTWLKTPPFREFAISKGYISDEDRMVLNPKSPPQKAEVLSWIFPDLIGTSKPVLTKYIRDNAAIISNEKLNVLVSLRDGNTEPLFSLLMRNYRNDLIARAYLIPADMGTINWNSVDQVLPLAKIVEPRLAGLSKEDIDKTIHPLLRDLQKYKSAQKLLTTYGEEFIIKYVDSDGKVRCNFNQILSTGRVSTSDPNMQNVVVTEQVGTRYRNAFVCEPGWVFVDSDYVSQELVIIAYISNDPVWMDCIRNGYDLHSVCADLVYKKKWYAAQSEGCAYYAMSVNADGSISTKQKCSCKGHKVLRNSIKPINFGLAYGMSEYKLSGTLGMSLPEAKALIREYFLAFPAIKGILETLGTYGVENGFIKTLYPFNRKRYFPYWREYRGYINAHLTGVMNVKQLGEIERASKNHPIQGTSADITKVAMVLIRNYIRDNELWDSIKLQAQVHDQVTTICIKEIANEWKITLNELMCEAGRLVIPSGILQAETQITSTWTK
jgi:DNA polymerase I-like protein with 3'-5' exonuclease and polymerase domains